jgi:hypothetical protein
MANFNDAAKSHQTPRDDDVARNNTGSDWLEELFHRLFSKQRFKKTKRRRQSKITRWSIFAQREELSQAKVRDGISAEPTTKKAFRQNI